MNISPIDTPKPHKHNSTALPRFKCPQNPSVLVTGSTGFIGNHTILRLLKDQDIPFNVLAITRPDSQRKNSLTYLMSKFPDRLLVHESSLSSDTLSSVLSSYNIKGVFHIGSLVGGPHSERKPFEFWQSNVGDTTYLLKAMNDANVNNLVFTSSSSVYDTKKNWVRSVSETDALNPDTTYGKTKLNVELILKDLAGKKNKFGNSLLNYITLRIFNVAGAENGFGESSSSARGYTSLPFKMSKQTLSNDKKIDIFVDQTSTSPDGTLCRDYIHVNDVADAQVMAMKYLLKHPNTAEEVNIGSGKGVTSKQVLNTLNAIVSDSSDSLNASYTPTKFTVPGSFIANTEKAFNIFGWHPKHSFTKVVADTYDYISKQINVK